MYLYIYNIYIYIYTYIHARTYILRIHTSTMRVTPAKASFCASDTDLRAARTAGTRYILQSFFCHPCEQKDLYRGCHSSAKPCSREPVPLQATPRRKCSPWPPMRPASSQTQSAQRPLTLWGPWVLLAVRGAVDPVDMKTPKFVMLAERCEFAAEGSPRKSSFEEVVYRIPGC